MDPKLIGEIALAATVLGTVGGFIENKTKPGTGWYRVGAFLASLGVDLTFLLKMGGAPS